MVTSDHNPIDIEHKKVEFDHAMYGTIGLESSFGVLNSIFTTKKSVHLLVNGKSRFGIESSPIAVGSKADLSLFNPDMQYEFDEEHIQSKSKNSAFLNKALKGKAYGIIANNKIHLNT